MNQSRTCAKCGVSFSINDQGRYVVEEGWATSRLARYSARLAKKWQLESTWNLLRKRTDGSRELFAAQWMRLPKAWRWALVLGGSGFLAALVVSWAFTAWVIRDDVPVEHGASLQVRAEMACHALLVGDGAVLTGLASRETQEDSQRWFTRVRPANWPESAELARSAQVELRTLFKSTKTQRAAVYFSIRTPVNSAKDNPDITGTLCWTLGHDGRWQLDGRRTMAELATARTTD